MSQINFVRYGKKNGEPILLLHGFPGSAIHGMFFRHFAVELGVEVFSLDRPGYGLTPLPTTAGFDGWVDMIESFIIAHNLKKFSVMGISGGAPFAVAIAQAFPSKVKKLGIICGLAPWHENKQGFSWAQNIGFLFYKNTPKFITKNIIANKFITDDYHASLDRLAMSLNSKDKEILAHPEVRQNLVDGMIEARRQGIAGIKNDLDLYSSDWKIKWNNITMPSQIWFGTDDLMLNYRMAYTFKDKIPHLSIKLFPHEGHFSLPVLHAETILIDFLNMEKI